MRRFSMSARDNTTLKGFDDLPNAAAVDVKTVAALCGCSISTVWERSRRGALPEPIRIGGSARWNVGKLRAILAGGIETNQSSS
ncbi:transcriptional regulator [Pandoraea faecigallinarum]|uniref:Transcriptional regulator n=2 Tax=Pandoraea faecigallinarum TaxID=656179 RepID=A0A0H3WNI6_9BURK|nr:transcriptional regulator [Pandoraea faecigallinarum]